MTGNWELECFGTTTAEIRDTIKRHSDVYTPDFMAISMLSDVQQLIELGRLEDARKRINVVKYVISTYCKNKEKGEII